MEEYQQYRESEAWQRDAAFWAEQRRQLPPPASLSPAPLPGRSASADILRLKLEFTDGEFRQLATQLSGVQRTDLALRWQPCGWGDCAIVWTTPPDLSLCVDWARRR